MICWQAETVFDRNYGLVQGASPGPPDPQGISIAILLGDPLLCWQVETVLIETMSWFGKKIAKFPFSLIWRNVPW